jgi:hypothetical protein
VHIAGASAAQQLALRAVADSQAPLCDRTYATLHAADAQLMDMITPLVEQCASGWEARNSARAFGEARGAGLTWRHSRSIDGALLANTWFSACCTTRLRALRSWRDTLDASIERLPAYSLDAAFGTPDSELDALRYILGQAAASTQSFSLSTSMPDGSLLPQHATWLDDFQRGHAAGLALITAAHAFVARQRMESLRCYLDAAEAVLRGMIEYSAASGRALKRRVVWISASCEALGASAGDRIVAQAAPPPLALRLKLTAEDPEGMRLWAIANVQPPRGQPPQRFSLAEKLPSAYPY